MSRIGQRCHQPGHSRMKNSSVLLALLSLVGTCYSGDPVFDPTTLMKLALIPSDATVGSVIYRLRATDSDFDYPLQFELIGDTGRADVSIETLPCTRYNSICHANVILQRRLEPGRYYDFKVSVRDTKGRSSRISCSITATNATTPRDTIFPHIPALIMVPENAKRGTELEHVVARKNPLYPKNVFLELWGSPLFAIRQRIISPENTEGTIFLLGPLDFETQSMYHLTLLANDAYAEPGKDSRNIAGLEVVVVVEDVQDMPPVFTSAPPITNLQKNLVPGDIVVQVHAEDGDKGNPRQIRYGLVSEGNPFTPFFNINETSGDIILQRPLDEIAAITHVGSPVLLTVVAEEVKLSRDEPEAMSSTVKLAFILPDRENTPPYFENDFYITHLDENSPQGSALVFNEPYIPQVSDDDAGKNGVFSLMLANNNGTFEISPTVGERRAEFLIKVRDSRLLDYEERKSVVFQIVAQELGPTSNISVSANVTVYLNDVNDNPPVFFKDMYEVELAENVTAGTRVVQVQAEDIDTGIYGKVQYTAILGYLNTSLRLDPITGVITIATNNHGFDREAMPDLRFLVEARDNDGIGNRATVPLTITLLDVNDEVPIFEKDLYEFILSPNLRNFTSPAIIKAVDNDAEPPNNIVRYEIIHGNYEDKFAINEVTGELFLLEPLKKLNSKSKQRLKRQFDSEEGETEVYTLTARAYDLGVPRLFSTTTIRVYPPESKTRTMLFIVPGLHPDRQKTENILSTITGGRVHILEVRPYQGTEVGATDVTAGNDSKGRSVVVASVFSTGNNVVDVSHIQQQLAKNKTLIDTEAVSDRERTTVYKGENRLLFWLLILLAILIALALLCLILCCICEGCPLYMAPRKRVIRVNSTDDDVRLVVQEKGVGKESKSIQASEWQGRREAWSADQTDSRTKPTQWKFNKRNNNKARSVASPKRPVTSGGDYITPMAAANKISVEDKRTVNQRKGPNIIYTRELQVGDEYLKKEKEYLEDLENDYDRIATLQYSHKHQKRHYTDDHDIDSMRRHELERGSEEYIKSDIKNYEVDFTPRYRTRNVDMSPANHGREQYFIKDGNTEILRLVTRGRNDEERYVNLPVNRPATLIPPQQYIVVDSGKDILMQRFMQEQGIEGKVPEEKFRHAVADNKDSEIPLRSRPAASEYHQQSYPSSEVRHPHLLFRSMTNLQDSSFVEPHIPGSIPPQELINDINTKHYVNTNSYHHGLLESSLIKQNELLRQILLDKERVQHSHETLSQIDAKLETQSLPGHSVMATQTECHMSTQTDPQIIKPKRRKARSDNDDSFSETEYELVVDDDSKEIRWVKRKKPKRRKAKFKIDNPRRSVRVDDVKRKIRTPILEETELSVSLDSDKNMKVNRSDSNDEFINDYQNQMRRKPRTGVPIKDRKKYFGRTTKSALTKELLLEISDTLHSHLKSTTYRKKNPLKKQEGFKDEDGNSESDENNEHYIEESQSNSNNNSDDSLEVPKEQHKKVKQLKDKRNAVFSRQGSSTDAKDALVESAQSPSESITNRDNIGSSKDLIKAEKKTDSYVETSESNDALERKIPKKHIDKSGIDVTKSVPRYMQWYNSKASSTSVQKMIMQKSVPDKPKRNSKVKPTNFETKQNSDKVQQLSVKRVPDSKSTSKEKDKKSLKTKGDVKEVKLHPRLLKEENVKPVPEGPLPDCHPLLQHSEHRYEHEYQNQNPMCFVQPTHLPQYLGTQPALPVTQNNDDAEQPVYSNQQSGVTKVKISGDHLKVHEADEVSKTEITSETSKQGLTTGSQIIRVKAEDDDSGIAMNPNTKLQHIVPNIKRLPITEKKSVFTIAYDDVHMQQIRPDSSSTSY